MELCDLCFNNRYGNKADLTIHIVMNGKSFDTLKVCVEHYDMYIEEVETK